VDARRRRCGRSQRERASAGRGDAPGRGLDQGRSHTDPPGRTQAHPRLRGRGRLRLPRRQPGPPARLGPHPRRGRGHRHSERVEQLPVRPGPKDLEAHQGPAQGNRCLHDALGPDQMRRSAAEDRLPRCRLLAPAGCARRDPDHPPPADPADVRLTSEVTEIDPSAQTVTITDNFAGTSDEVGYDMLHVVPPQSAPDWIKDSPVRKADDPNGYVDVDPNTLQHTQWPEIFSLGDAGSTPNSKTGAAIRKQAPV